MRLAQIRNFVAVIQAGSLRGAARTVGISQPAITKSLRQLEAELGVALLQRNARGAVATPAGKTFLARARVIEAELRKTAEDLEPYRGGSQGSVALGIAPQASLLIMPAAMEEFRRRQPTAGVRIVEGVTTALLPLVRDETLDFAVAGSHSEKLDPAMRFRPLTRMPLAVAARLNHPLRTATSLRELADAAWLMYYPVGTGAMLEKAFASADLPMPRSIVQCESYAIALALIAETDTLGLINPKIIERTSGPYRMQQIRVREAIPAALIGLYQRSDAPLTSAAAAMAQAITASARRFARS